MLPKFEIGVKRNNLIIIAVIVVALLFLYFTVFSRRNSAPPEEPQSLIIDETPTAPDLGVTSSGFETAILASSLNAEVESSDYQTLDGAKSLLIRFDSSDKDVVRLKDYISSVSQGDFYRMLFWVKSDRDKKISLTAYGDKESQNLGELNITGNQEMQCQEILFEAVDDVNDLVLTSSDKAPASVWADDFLIEKLNVFSADEMAKLKKTACGNTTWRNVDFSSGEAAGNIDSGDFFSRPNRTLGQVFQPDKGDLSGIVFRVQRQGDGGKGAYRVKIYEIDEKSGLPGDASVANSLLDYRYPPEAVKKEQEMRAAFSQIEKAIADKKIDEDNLTGETGSLGLTLDQESQQRAEKRRRQMEIDIQIMKDAYNAPQEVTVPIAMRLDPQKKYMAVISNESVLTDSGDYLRLSLTAGGQGEAFYSEGNGNIWKKRQGSLFLKTLFAKRQTQDGVFLPSGSTVSDLGEGKGVFRFDLANGDYNSFSGINGRKIWELDSGKFKAVDWYGNYTLSSEFRRGEDDQAVYKIETLYPIEKLTLRNIIYQQSIFAEFSFDGKNWEEIASASAPDPKAGQQTINSLVLQGDGQSRRFYLRFLPLLGDSSVKNIEMEAEIKTE
jgi:hypothetical protein